MIDRLVILALAATRLTRAVQHEDIGAPVRDWLHKRTASKPIPAGMTRIPPSVMAAQARREWLREMVTCDHCFGFWLTFGVVAAWRFRPLRPLIEALAAAAVLSAVVDHYPGWD